MQKKSEMLNILIIAIAVPICIIGGYFMFGAEKYYIPCAAVLILAMLPFFISFEKKKASPREIAIIAALTAIAVISRAAFYFAPQIKPIAAVIIIGAVSFGYEVGFLTGALSMLLSNILFGFGAWTPFQMFGLGAVGFLCGLIFHSSKYKNNRFLLGSVGGALTFVVYGIIVDTNSVLMLMTDNSPKAALSIYMAGMPMNGAFALTTTVFLILFGNVFISKLGRLQKKYGIFDRGELK